MPREHNPAIPADTNALLNQIEDARSVLFNTILGARPSPAVQALAMRADSDVQAVMDRIIDEGQGATP